MKPQEGEVNGISSLCRVARFWTGQHKEDREPIRPLSLFDHLTIPAQLSTPSLTARRMKRR